MIIAMTSCAITRSHHVSNVPYTNGKLYSQQRTHYVSHWNGSDLLFSRSVWDFVKSQNLSHRDSAVSSARTQ